MPVLARNLKVVVNGAEGSFPTRHIFIGEDEFPYFTKRDSLKIEPYLGDDGTALEDLHYVTVTMLVEGTVDIPDGVA